MFYQKHIITKTERSRIILENAVANMVYVNVITVYGLPNWILFYRLYAYVIKYVLR
jgi:hypothetical protein